MNDITLNISINKIEYAVRTQLTWTQLPDKNLLSQKLHKAIAVAREHYQSNETRKI